MILKVPSSGKLAKSASVACVLLHLFPLTTSCCMYCVYRVDAHWFVLICNEVQLSEIKVLFSISFPWGVPEQLWLLVNSSDLDSGGNILTNLFQFQPVIASYALFSMLLYRVCYQESHVASNLMVWKTSTCQCLNSSNNAPKWQQSKFSAIGVNGLAMSFLVRASPERSQNLLFVSNEHSTSAGFKIHYLWSQRSTENDSHWSPIQ